jgi:REP element-mobilizing transposase RayT
VPVFRFRRAAEIFLRTLEAYRRKFGFRVHAYAVMPNHFHMFLWFPPDARLVDFLRDFKSLAGKRILEWLREEKLERLLSRFRLVRAPRREKDAHYCVLQYNSHVKPIVGISAIRQKIEYIHANPVREGLAATPEAYPYSSARAYAGKGLSLVKIDRVEFPYD